MSGPVEPTPAPRGRRPAVYPWPVRTLPGEQPVRNRRTTGLPAGLPARALLAVAAGLALSQAFPGAGLWALAAPSVAALALAVRGVGARRGALLGMLAGWGFFVPHLSWAGVYLGYLPWFSLATLQAAFVALLGAALTAAWRVPGGAPGTAATIGGLWVAQEALRGRVPFGGFPWGRLAFSQADAPTLGLAALGGAPLVSFAVAATGGALAVAAASLAGAAPRPGFDRLVPAGATLGAAVALTLGGLAVPTPVDAPRSAQVAAVQGNVPTAGLDFNAQRRAVLDNHVTTTVELARRVSAGTAPRPDVVLWPENSSDIDPLRNPDAGAAVDSAAAAVGVPILLGAVLQEPVGQLSNAAIVWGPPGGTAAVPAGPGAKYVKRHPAPFGEYIPYRSFFRMISTQVDLVARDFAAGSTVGVLPVGPATLGPVICFEVAYDDLVQDPVRAGADLLVVQTNNATFGYSDESVQQLAMSRLRAVETGRSVVHVSTVGVSALFAPDGTALDTSGLFTRDVLQARLPLRTGLTPAVRLGPVPEALLAGAAVLAVAAGALRRRRRTPVGEAVVATGQDGVPTGVPSTSARITEGDR